MASALCKVVSRSLPRLVRKTAPVVTSVRHGGDTVEVIKNTHDGKVVGKDRVYPNELGHSVGKARYELLGIRKGVDVWDDLPHSLEEGEGTFSNPKVVTGPWDHRMVACCCDTYMDDLIFTRLENNSIDQCKCGYWWTYKKVDKEGKEVGHGLASNRFEWLEKFAGKEDPFEVAVRKIRMFGSVNYVPSTRDERLIGCICEEECVEIAWWPLKKGGVTKCGCGHLFQLVGTEKENKPPNPPKT